MFFGPAYKGIPISVATAIAYSRLYGKEIRYCSNRKEVKDHGDAGIMLGSPLKDGDRVVILEDVTTSGKSIQETYPIITAQADINIKGMMVSLNRLEQGLDCDTETALTLVGKEYGFPTASIVDMDEVKDYLYNKEIGGKVIIDDGIKKALDEYYDEYGVKKA